MPSHEEKISWLSYTANIDRKPVYSSNISTCTSGTLVCSNDSKSWTDLGKQEP